MNFSGKTFHFSSLGLSIDGLDKIKNISKYVFLRRIRLQEKYGVRIFTV